MTAVATPKTETAVRVVTLPIWEVVEPAGKIIDTFRPAWRLSTDLANWCQRELCVHDAGGRTPDAAKITKFTPKMFPGDRALYAHVTAACPFRSMFNGAAGSMGAVVKAVEDAWKGHPRFGRFSVLWKGEARPAVFRFPYPWPVRGQELRIYRNEQNRPAANITLPGGRVQLRLADGRDFHRQLRSFDWLLANPDRIKQAKVTARFTAGKLVGADLRVVGAFDPTPKKTGMGAVVRTDPNAMFVAEVEGRQPWILNADHAKHLQARHKVYLQRLAEDTKHEKRLTRRQRAGVNDSRAVRCEKHQKRIDTLIHQMSAQVVGYLDRCGVSSVVYDDSIQSYMPDGFAWANLKQRLQYKTEDIGAEWIDGTSTGE